MDTILDNQTIVVQDHSCNLINHVFLGDVLEMLAQIPDGTVDCVFSDPDYNVNIRYNGHSYTREFKEYIDWYIQLNKELVRILRPTGNLFSVNYPKQNSYLRVGYLDQACYEVFDYTWIYNCNIGHSPNRLTSAHRSILHGRMSEHSRFYKDQIAVPYQNPEDKRIQQRLAEGSVGRMPYDWFYFDLVKNVSKEKTFHACQIPQKLSEMLILSCTKPGDVVCIPFGGSGAELDVCQQLGRNFIAAEIDPLYHQLICDRLSTGEIRAEYRPSSK